MAASLMEAVFDYHQQQQGVPREQSTPAGRSNFNALEKEIIQQLVHKYHDVLAFRKNDHNTVMNKKRCWSLIELEYNSKGLVTKRTAKQLRKCWENLKARTKKTAHNLRLTLEDCISETSTDNYRQHQQQQHHHRGHQATSAERRHGNNHARMRSPIRRPFPVGLPKEEEEIDDDDDDIYSVNSPPETTISIIPDVVEVLKQEPSSPDVHVQYGSSPETPEERVQSTSEHGGYSRAHSVVIHEAMSSTSLPVCDTSKIPLQVSMNVPLDFCPNGTPSGMLKSKQGGAEACGPPGESKMQQEEHRLKMIVLRQRKLHEEQQHEAKMAEHSAAMSVYALQREYWSQMLQNISGQN